jgi:hypothetical protein
MVSFFQKITDVLDQYQIPYMLSGSIAMGLYTVPRMTRDIDFIIHLQAKNVDLFVSSFKEGFYCDRDVIKEAIEGPVKMFNIIDHATGYKAISERLFMSYLRKTVYYRSLFGYRIFNLPYKWRISKT